MILYFDKQMLLVFGYHVCTLKPKLFAVESICDFDEKFQRRKM